MWQSMPDQQLAYIKRRNSTLVDEAMADRLASRRRDESGLRFTGLRLRLGTFLIVVGRTLCEDEVLASNPAN